MAKNCFTDNLLLKSDDFDPEEIYRVGWPSLLSDFEEAT